MPFYEYECQSCKFYTEVMQKISDAPLRKCPSCGKSTLKKLVSAPVFRLKGSGWYETDFKSDKEAKRNLASERDEPKPAAEESKPEAKTAAATPAPAPAPGTGATPSAKAPPSVTTTEPRGRVAAARRKPAAAKAAPRKSPARPKSKPAARAKGRGRR
jgi:putative FmdB family regulatory protein